MADDDYSGFTQDQSSGAGGGYDQYRNTFASAERQYGLPNNLLTAISMQENVAAHHNNPLGLSDDSGVKTFAPDEANAAIYRQAELLTNPTGPYARYARTHDIDDLAAVYSPPGARNDIYGTNATEASGIKANLAKLGSGDDYSGFNEDHDYSGFNPDVKKDEYAGLGTEILPANHPQVKNGWTPGQTIKAIWDVGTALDANNAYGLVKQQSLQGSQDPKVRAQAQVPDDYDQQIRQVQDSPYLSPEDKQKNIAVLREQQTRERDTAFLSLPDYQKKAIQTAQQVQKDNPQGWEKAVGSVGPYLKTVAGGPLAPIMAAQQATAETYGNSLDENVKAVKKNHPGYSDSEALVEALKVANTDAQGSGIATLAASGIDVPAAGPLIARIVQKIGVGAATMEIANTLAQVQRNMATKEHVDPNKEWFDGLNDIWFHVSNLATGAVFAGPHALGEIGRPSADPIEDRVPIAEVPEQPKAFEPTKTEPEEPKQETKKEGTSKPFVPSTEYQDVPDWAAVPPGGEYKVNANTGQRQARWADPPSPDKVTDMRTGNPQTEPPKTEPERVVSAATRKGEEIRTGSFHGVSMGDWDPDDPEVEQGFTTNKGRFISRQEAHELASGGKQGSLYAEHLSASGTLKEYKDPFEEAKQIVLDTHRKLGGAGIEDVAKELGVDPQEIQSDWDKLTDEGKIKKQAQPEQHPIIAAYQRIAAQTGRTSVPITDLIKESGLPAEEVKQWLVIEVGDKGGGQLDEGDIGAATQTGKGDYVDFMGRKRTLADLSRMVQQPEPQPPSPPVPETEPWISSIANRYTQERQASGELGEVTPSKGVTPQEMVNRGLAMSPAEVDKHIADVNQGVGDSRQVAAVRIREAQLSQESQRLGRIADANPNDPVAQDAAKKARETVTAFLNGPLAKVKAKWHQEGEGFQDEIPIDMGSYNGQYEKWIKSTGKEPPKNVEETMKASARKVRQAQAAETAAMKNLSEQIAKTSARRRLPTPDEVRDRIIARMKDDPCAT